MCIQKYHTIASLFKSSGVLRSQNLVYFHKKQLHASKDWRILVLIPVPLICEASALQFELISLAEVPALHETSNNVHLYCL